MAMFAAFPSTIMDSTTVGLAPKAPSPLLWRRPKAASIMVDGKAANMATPMMPIPDADHFFNRTKSCLFLGMVL